MSEKTYLIEADVTFRYKLMVDATNEKQMIRRAKKGQWDWQYMHEENDLKDPIKVTDIQIIEVRDNT